MKILDKLERRFGRYALRNIMLYIVTINLAVFALSYLYPEANVEFRLMLIPSLVLKGEVWRLITFIFIPPSSSIIWILFSLYLYYLIGSSLEHEWGSFKFNLFYFIGIIATIAASFLTNSAATASFINMSLFLAFAYLFPNFEILLFFILPVKMKYLGLLDVAYIAYSIIFLPVPSKAAAVASVINCIIFFGPDIVSGMKTNGLSYFRRKKFSAKVTSRPYMHKCTVCGKTELDDPDMDFRYCSKCSGDHEYCMDHLYDHKHIE
ncbi:rhomboid family intramembrane serine protease [Clostridium oryzae]|uniref:Rhomboid family protein n=1 Tax=Clostridium oryzae TaxID=1450648 RepID=A0A1V4IGA8_9CLOT|nr:rhomboid family intramembrane serine protease [Clostridium oryzae]OPJ58695.1 rhomboid family protein [Clostridium oryzae]